MKKAISVLLVVVLLFGCSSCTAPEQQSPNNPPTVTQPEYAESPLTLSKNEAVFASLDSAGAPLSVEVTDRLITDRGEVRVEDITFLNDIRNIKGTEVPIQDGVNLTWHMQASQLYYSGTTTKDLPVSLHIRYFFNDEEKTAQELQGKSGHFTIEVTAENQLRHGELYTPFLLAGGALLEDVQHIEVTNGGTVGDGSKDIAFGVLLPGMGESLELGDNTLLPDSFSISFDAKNLTLKELYFGMIPLSTDKLSDALESIFSSTNLPGTDLGVLFNNIGTFTAQTDMEGFLKTASENLELLNSAAILMQDLNTITPLLTIFQKYMTAENAKRIQGTLDSLDTTSLQEYASLLKNPTFIALLGDLGVVSSAFGDLIPQITSLLSELNSKEVKTAMQAFPSVLADLEAFSNVAQQNEDWVNTLQTMSESQVITQFSTFLNTIQKMVESGTLDTLSALANQADGLQERLESILALGKKYSIFTIAPEDAVSSVYFVMKVTL